MRRLSRVTPFLLKIKYLHLIIARSRFAYLFGFMLALFPPYHGHRGRTATLTDHATGSLDYNWPISGKRSDEMHKIMIMRV